MNLYILYIYVCICVSYVLCTHTFAYNVMIPISFVCLFTGCANIVAVRCCCCCHCRRNFLIEIKSRVSCSNTATVSRRRYGKHFIEFFEEERKSTSNEYLISFYHFYLLSRFLFINLFSPV